VPLLQNSRASRIGSQAKGVLRFKYQCLETIDELSAGAPKEIRTPDPQIRGLSPVFEFARFCWKFAPAWHAHACQRNLSIYDEALYGASYLLRRSVPETRAMPSRAVRSLSHAQLLTHVAEGVSHVSPFERNVL